MVIPLAVLGAEPNQPGWERCDSVTPVWWEDQHVEQAAQPSVLEGAKSRPVHEERGQALLDFEKRREEERKPAAPRAANRGLYDRLHRSKVYEEQKALAGRAVPAEADVRRILIALEEHGGKLTVVALGRALVMPSFRLRGLLAAVQRLLNVEGYPILIREETSDTVELNRDLLAKQFELA